MNDKKDEAVEKKGKEKETEEFYTVKEFIKDAVDLFPFLNIFLNKSDKETAEVNKEIEEIKDDIDTNFKEPQIIGRNKNHGQNNGLGAIHFVIKYETCGILKVIIQKAEELVGKDPRGTSDPYAVLSFIPSFRENHFKTMPKMKTLSPVWNHVFVFKNFSEEDLKKHSIKIVLFDWNKYGAHEDLGEVFYELSKLCPKTDTSENSGKHSIAEHCSKKSNCTSKLFYEVDEVGDEKVDEVKMNLIQQWVDESEAKSLYDDDIEEHDINLDDDDRRILERSASMIAPNRQGENSYDSDESSDYHIEETIVEGDGLDEVDKESSTESNQNIIRRIAVMKYLSPLPNSRSKFGDLHVSLHYDIRLRRMVVTIIKARNMIDQSKRSLIPYCTVTHLLITKDREKNKGVYRTSYRYYTSEPVWNEEFYLNVYPQKIKNTAVEIKVFNSTQASKTHDELLGIIRLGLKSYQKQRAHYTNFLKSIGIPVAQWHDIRQ